MTGETDIFSKQAQESNRMIFLHDLQEMIWRADRICGTAVAFGMNSADQGRRIKSALHEIHDYILGPEYKRYDEINDGHTSMTRVDAIEKVRCYWSGTSDQADQFSGNIVIALEALGLLSFKTSDEPGMVLADIGGGIHGSV
jgi:hypothetical protein